MPFRPPSRLTLSPACPVVVFFVPGAFPSLENWRKRSRTSARNEDARALKNRIDAFKADVGTELLRHSKAATRSALYGRPVAVHIWMHRQRLDLDNCKLMIDAMKGIVYPDDRKRFVRKIVLEDVTDAYGPGAPPGVFFMVRPYRGRKG